MNRISRYNLAALITLLVASLAAVNAAEKTSEPEPAAPASLRLTLPPTVYAVPGVEVNLYFANVILAPPTEEFSFAVTCDVGETDAQRWKLNATAKQLGEYPLTLKVSDNSGRLLAQGTTKVRVVPADAGRGQDIALLIVGDSLTHASAYPNEVARLLSQSGNPTWQMLGTHKPAAAAENVAHEGYGGWTWRAFNSRFDPNGSLAARTNSSPFVFAAGDPPTPTLDVGRYIAERCGGRAPDYVTFMLGINDCFGLKADNPQALDDGITAVFQEADQLLAAFRQAAPRAELGVCLTTPPNLRDAAFVANYKTAYPRWNWRQVQHRLVERQLEHFGQREGENIFLVPTQLNLDIAGGYPDNNAVHPNVTGYRQIGASIYAWLKSRLAATAAAEPAPANLTRACLVDGKPARNDLYADIAGVRLYACSEECLKQIQEKGAHVGLVEKSGREPELIPVQRSRERTKEEILEGMVLIPGGEFARSGEYLVRRNRKPEPEKIEGYRVQVSSFYMDRYEVTIEDYCRFLNEGNEKYLAGGISRDPDGKFVPPKPELAKYPIGGVNYFQARGYALWAGKRLPTEAEWEFAHGGPQGRTYPWGNDEPGQTRANFGPSFGGRRPVGSFPEGRTPEGVFDLGGNIGEWCADYFDENDYRKPGPEKLVKDPQGPKTGFLRVYRLGCQCKDATATDLRGNLRCFASPFRAAGCVGIRCVVTAGS